MSQKDKDWQRIWETCPKCKGEGRIRLNEVFMGICIDCNGTGTVELKNGS